MKKAKGHQTNDLLHIKSIEVVDHINQEEVVQIVVVDIVISEAEVEKESTRAVVRGVEAATERVKSIKARSIDHVSISIIQRKMIMRNCGLRKNQS
jgi:hypothetical protein